MTLDQIRGDLQRWKKIVKSNPGAVLSADKWVKDVEFLLEAVQPPDESEPMETVPLKRQVSIRKRKKKGPSSGENSALSTQSSATQGDSDGD